MHTEPSDSPGPAVVQTIDQSIACLTLNRADRFNPLSEQTLAALQQAFAQLAGNEAARIVILGATGRAFSAGHDLREMRAKPSQDYYRRLFQQSSRLMRTIVEFPKPVIARVQGLAAAAGCQLVATCDLAVAADTARFAVSGITLGLFCSTPGVALSRNVSRKRAFEMLMTGEFIDAQTARDYGLVNRVVAAQDLDAEVDRLCQAILRHPQVSVETGKRMFYRQLEKNLEGAYDYASEVMACNMMDAEALEGVQAFLDKRAPDWPHRS